MPIMRWSLSDTLLKILNKLHGYEKIFMMSLRFGDVGRVKIYCEKSWQLLRESIKSYRNNGDEVLPRLFA